MKISILGAPGTGKTQLAGDLAAHFQTQTGTAQVFISDGTPLMSAIYSDLLLGDRSLYDSALDQQSRYDLTLLTGLDLPAVADGLPREAVDALLRAALGRAGIAFTVVYGSGPERSVNALKRISHHGAPASPLMAPEPAPGARWVWSCETCSDPACEHRLFTDKLGMDQR